MKKQFLLIALIFISQISQADIIRCSFTEPFVSTEYNTATSTLKYKEGVTEKKQTVRNVLFQIRGPGHFQLVAKTGKVLQDLKLNNQGSDGMSEFQYPYSVEDKSGFSSLQLDPGGCVSNFLRTK